MTHYEKVLARYYGISPEMLAKFERAIADRLPDGDTVGDVFTEESLHQLFTQETGRRYPGKFL